MASALLKKAECWYKFASSMSAENISISLTKCLV